MKTEWEIKKLGEVCEFINGKAHENIISETGKYILINSKFISSDGKIFKRTNEQLTPLFKGDLVFVMSDVPKGKALSKFFLVDSDNKYTLNQRIGLIRNNSMDKKFLYYQLNRNQHFINFDNGENQTNLRKKDILNCPLLVPPLPIQKKIVEILDSAFEKIAKAKENSEANLKNAKEVFESYLQKVFENKGEDWEETKLSDLCDLITKGSSPKWQGINYVEKPGIMFITSENIGKNFMIYDKVKYVEEKFNKKDSKSILKKGDVLTNIVGASIGRTAIFNKDDIANINQAVCILRCNKNKLLNQYLAYLLNSPFLISHLHDNEVNNARANLSLTFFREIIISIPNISKQKEITTTIEKFSEQTKQLESIYSQKLSCLDELKQSILQKAFKGELTEVKA